MGDFLTKLSVNSSNLLGGNTSLLVRNISLAGNNSVSPDPFGSTCVRNQPIFKEELDVASVRFSIIGGPNITVSTQAPTVFLLDLNSFTNSGGTLNLDLRLNQVRSSPSVTDCLYLMLECIESVATVWSLTVMRHSDLE